MTRPEELDERFPGPDLAPEVWTTSYLPAWSSRAAAAAHYTLEADHPGREHRRGGDARGAGDLDAPVPGRVAEHGGLFLAHEEPLAERLLALGAAERAGAVAGLLSGHA